MTAADLPTRPSDRTLHLVDLDNLVGGPGNTHLVEPMMAAYLDLAGYRAGDHLVVAADASLARSAIFQMPAGTRFLVGRGPDGADDRLLAATPLSLIARRYSRLVVGSGDHCFAGLLRAARLNGVSVLAVGRPHCMAISLWRAAGACRLLPTG